MVCEDRYIYVFNGEQSAGVIEVLDVHRENIDQHCQKLVVPMLTDITSSVMMVLTEPEALLILGGDNRQLEAYEDYSESQEEQSQSHNDATSQASIVSYLHRLLILDESG